MTKRFVFFNTYNGFTNANKGVDYDDESIVFIKDRKLIYTNETGFNAIPDGGTNGDILVFDGTNYVWQSPDNIQVDGQDLSDILNDKVSYDDLQNYYTKSEVDNAITTATDDMATQSWVESKEYLTEHQSLENYYTKSETDTAIETAVNDLNISQYETITGAADKYQPKGDYLTEHQDLTEYAKKTEVTSEIKDAIDGLVNGASTTMDTLKELEDAITGNKSIIDTLNSAITEKADKTEIADMATQAWVKSQEYLTEHQDISNLATKDEVTAVDNKLSGYYTKEQVDQKIEEIDVTDQLTDYETIAGAESKYQPKGEYYTKDEVDGQITTVGNSLNNLGQTFGKNLSEAETRIINKIAYIKTANNSAQMEFCTSNGQFSHTEGYSTTTTNIYEHASGVRNKSIQNSENFGDELNTLFSFGNGYNNSNPHNAFEIKQDGTIYVVDMSADGQYYEKPMIKLQDLINRMIQEAVGNIDLSNYYTKEETDNLLNPLDCGTY